MTARRRSKAVYVDTGPLYALADKRDQNHQRALKAFTALHKSKTPIRCPVSTILELHMLALRRRLKNAAMIARVTFDNYGPTYPEESDMQAALEAVTKFNDQGVTLADALLASMAKGAGARVFTFDDRHFGLMRADMYE